MKSDPGSSFLRVIRNNFMATANSDKRYFLNRLALEQECDPLSLDPYWILSRLYSETPPEKMQEFFAEFCEAAIAPAYIWKSQTPVDLLRFTGKLEQLIEAAFLLLSWIKAQKGPIKKDDQSPAQVIRKFFRVQPLSGWKRSLQRWQTGAFSGNSVAEFADAEELLPFVQWMEKLLVATAAMEKEGKRSVSV
jgi:hypothetical protein